MWAWFEGNPISLGTSDEGNFNLDKKVTPSYSSLQTRKYSFLKPKIISKNHAWESDKICLNIDFLENDIES